ncbi:MAG: hypothetical protein SWJ54_21915, partial [Cyanobacteriota bacterium]|nr:hypothetical protein [Cyanobacteriota bacterium]
MGRKVYSAIAVVPGIFWTGCPKVFSREVFQRIAPRSRGWLLDPEIMIQARRLNLKIVQIPVEFLKREHG